MRIKTITVPVQHLAAATASLTALGAAAGRSPRDVRGGTLIATPRDADDNLFGLFQEAA
jgi:hypothetical protein